MRDLKKRPWHTICGRARWKRLSVTSSGRSRSMATIRAQDSEGRARAGPDERWQPDVALPGGTVGLSGAGPV